MPIRSDLGSSARSARRRPVRAAVRGGSLFARERCAPGLGRTIRTARALGLALGIGIGLGIGLLASGSATAQELIAPGVDGGGASWTGSTNAQQAVSLGQTAGSAALVDAGGHPRWVGGIGGVLAAQSVPEPSQAHALPLALALLAGLRRSGCLRRSAGLRRAGPIRWRRLAREPNP
ncbi:MAG: hypothetical protein R3F35_15550 [Myxococcota bacterium]